MESLSEFRRAFLNQWVTQENDPVIPLAAWNALADDSSKLSDPVVFAFDVAPDRRRAAIAAAGTSEDGNFHVEIPRRDEGTAWIVDELVSLNRKWKPAAIVCDKRSAGTSLFPELVGAGLEITPLDAAEHAQACGFLYDTVMEKKLRHLGDPALLSALDGACKRPLDASWAWNRKTSSTDISPLVAATLALWGAHTQEAPSAPDVWDLNQVLEELRERQAKEAQ
jgi:hypothetical protein